MAGATERVVTALIPLPLFFNPDRRGRRRAIPDALFVRTAEAVTI